MEEKIKKIINDLKPYLNSEGGDVEFIKYEDNFVYIKLTGACLHCAFRDDTIKYGILAQIQEEVPEVKDIITVDL